jgi:hypothetical protein
MSKSITKKELFKKHPNIDPYNGEIIEINSKRYNELVNKYGEPNKIKSPKSNKLISVGKGEYKKLKHEFKYTDEQLLNKSLPQLPNDVMPLVTKNLTLSDKRLINKTYNKETQHQFEEKNKQDIYNFIKKNWYSDVIEDMDYKMRDYGIAGYGEEGEDNTFNNVQYQAVNNLSMNDIIFYKKLINMIKNNQIIFVDEENYGYNKIYYFGFSSEGQLILHQ